MKSYLVIQIQIQKKKKAAVLTRKSNLVFIQEPLKAVVEVWKRCIIKVRPPALTHTFGFHFQEALADFLQMASWWFSALAHLWRA